MDNDAKSLSAVLGENLQRLRSQYGRSQDQVATSARRFGLRWDRATVAGIETGRRALDLGEYLLLPLVLLDAFGVEVDLLTLVPADCSVRLGRDAVAAGAAVRALMHGVIDEVDPGSLHTPASAKWQGLVAGAAENMAAAQRIWPGARPSVLIDAERDADRDVERRAAARLGVSPFEVAVAARRLWRRSMTEERDRRTGAGPGTPAASIKALAGHVTRQLTEELRPVVATPKEA